MPGGATSLTRDAAASLLATAFLCLTPGAAGWSFPTFCFRALWSECHYPSIAAKLDCHLHYHVSRAAVTPPPPGVLRFERRVLDGVAAAAEENSRAVPLCRLLVEPRASICASHAPLRANFANASLGGGALSGGCVQEEILFSQRPELCVGLLLCEELGAEEAVVMRGAARYSATRGYHREFQWAGDVFMGGEDASPHDYVAFDALHFQERDAHGQWHGKNLRRELRKALAAFAVPGGGPAPAVATGNWGCGAFHGHPSLKALLQWAAASILTAPPRKAFQGRHEPPRKPLPARPHPPHAPREPAQLASARGSRENDWGFTQLLELTDLADPSKGWLGEDGSLTVEVLVLPSLWAVRRMRTAFGASPAAPDARSPQPTKPYVTLSWTGDVATAVDSHPAL